MNLLAILMNKIDSNWIPHLYVFFFIYMYVRVEGVTPHYQEIRVLPPIAALNDFHPSILH